MLLHNIFENQVDASPSALAVKSNGIEYSYRNIEERANQLAYYLIKIGVVKDDRIAIYFKRTELPIVAMLGILKVGATYIPIDRSFPRDRINHIVEDAEVNLLLTETDLLTEINVDCKTLNIQSAIIKEMPTDRRFDDFLSISENTLCYIIYTSGSTGNPKGVMTTHANVVHFVNSFRQVCKLTAKDRLYNGFAYSFDGSVEEIWMAFSSGASLIVANDAEAKLVSEAARLINHEKVTFLSTVPTFLGLIEEELPSVKLFILSGEVCPPELIKKWTNSDRRVLNVYGPTETTVNTTYWECRAGKPVTIGKPIPGYDIHILDNNNRPVRQGEKGELYIGGKGLAQGYLNQPKLTAKTFVKGIINGHTLYKTGDLVSLDKNGEIFFHGRIDSQVKIRGYRIELSEIESLLRNIPNISAAVAVVVEKNNMKELAAYVVPKDSSQAIVYDNILERIEQKLPPYMIPAYLEIIDKIPLLTSGKVDKKKLPQAKTALIKNNRKIINPRNKTEQTIVEVWKKVLEVDKVSIKDHFFNDLGGHSLLAVFVAVELRDNHNIEIAVRDIYTHPTLEGLASVAKETHKRADKTTKENSIPPSPKIAPFVKMLQALSLYLLYGITALPFVIAAIIFIEFINNDTSGIQILFGTVLITTLIYFVILLIGILLKWIIIGKIKPGSYPLNGFYYYRWWLVDRIQALTGSMFLAGSPLMVIYYRLMGAKVGKHTIIDTHLCSSWDNLTIGDNTSIGNETQLSGATIEKGYLKIGSINIGNNCFIGIHSFLGVNTTMEDNSKLGNISSIPEDGLLTKGDSKQGSPAIKSGVKVPFGKKYKPKPVRYGIAHLLLIPLLFTFIILVGIPVYFLIDLGLSSSIQLFKIGAILLSGFVYVISFCLITVLFKKILFNKVKPGVYKTESLFYLRKWLMDSIIRLSVLMIKPLYTTIFFPKWLRMLGAKVGKGAEISTVSQFSPELMHIGDESFFADGSIIGGRSFYKGYMEVSLTEIGKRSFIGNSAILPVGTGIGDNCLIGVLSVPPVINGKIENSTDWLGSPSFNLPKRDIVKGFDDKVIFNPSVKLRLKRYLIDSLRIFISSTIEIVGIFVLYSIAANLLMNFGLLKTIFLLPIASFLTAIAESLIVVAVKWLLMQKIKPTIKPLWSTFVWFNEAVNGAYESIMAQKLLPLVGTPFFAPFLRLLGCKIGKNVHFGTTLFSEFDLIHIDDNVTLNAGVVIQNHLFEDRIMKASSLEIKKYSSIGNMSIVLYDSVIEELAIVKPLSLVMKAEVLSGNAEWEGIPCRRIYKNEETVESAFVNLNKSSLMPGKVKVNSLI